MNASIRSCEQGKKRTAKNFTKEESQPADARWVQQAVLWRDKLGVSPKYDPLKQLGVEIKGIEMTDRIYTILTLSAAEQIMKLPKSKRTQKSAMKAAIANTVVDVSQNPCRQNSSEAGFANTLCTSTQLVHLGRASVVHPKELMWLQGHPKTTTFPDDMKVSDIRKLAGEGMALPSLAMCIWAQFMLKGFPDP